MFADCSIAVLCSPPQAPKANAYAERWVSSLRRECLDRLLIFHEHQLVRMLAEYETTTTLTVPTEVSISSRQSSTRALVLTAAAESRFGELRCSAV